MKLIGTLPGKALSEMNHESHCDEADVINNTMFASPGVIDASRTSQCETDTGRAEG